MEGVLIIKLNFSHQSRWIPSMFNIPRGAFLVSALSAGLLLPGLPRANAEPGLIASPP